MTPSAENFAFDTVNALRLQYLCSDRLELELFKQFDCSVFHHPFQVHTVCLWLQFELLQRLAHNIPSHPTCVNCAWLSSLEANQAYSSNHVFPLKLRAAFLFRHHCGWGHPLLHLWLSS